jgi:Arc/MetJ-type ribon-helix-helix transcriptional regulator
MPFGAHILDLLETALAEAFPYHSSLDNFVLRCGVPAPRVAKVREHAEKRNQLSGRFAKAPKRFVAQEMLRELGSGSPGDDRMLAVLVTAFCKGSFPNASPAARAAINALAESRTAEQREAEERRAEFRRQQRAIEREQESADAATATERQQLHQSLLSLNEHLDHQQRGYAFERFLNAFFEFEALSPRGSFKIVGEQIDGSFSWATRTHLVEAKWVKEPVAGAEFGAFIYKIAGKTADTRGLYTSVNGYSPQAIESLNTKGELRFVCIDGAHLLRALNPGRDFKKILEILWRHASETGEAYLPVGSSPFLSRGG